MKGSKLPPEPVIPHLPSDPSISSTSHAPEEEKKEHSHQLSKFDYDLFHDEDHVKLPLIRVKRISLPNKGERWKIFHDDKIVFTLEGSKLPKKEKNFLHTIDGVNFLLVQAKIGIKSFNSLRAELKKKLKKA